MVMVKKIWLILILLFFSCAIVSLTNAQEEVAKMKTAVFIIAEDSFRDEELLQPKEILENSGVEVKIASTSLDQARGTLGAMVEPDILVGDINVEDFDAVIFVGGAGSSQYWEDSVAHKIAQDTINQDKILAAICIAPVTLAKAGVLKGKQATVWQSEAGQLKAAGANYTGKSVQIDGKIITGSGPTAAKEFGRAILNALK